MKYLHYFLDKNEKYLCNFPFRFNKVSKTVEFFNVKMPKMVHSILNFFNLKFNGF